ncbi:MAG: tetratricopeptide repeat protein [Rhodocyclaceae bacterium]|nr:tetratricopeptide repeat protein [Rhodocyclaceae bacterium]MCP5232022.1 tetratricopeptide repeat protein [Zoogloeaceae bacterium]MCB1910820.1 tetratricopeptide repeat protein [Rhodocyclaceae bacterium]MCP5239544.1 tetratricopeptide repeat protein [Zoogloeaceae bacterium]MCP5255882.1 tetratricopeptide repeat protein [Zoogloeaceae bacterium]
MPVNHDAALQAARAHYRAGCFQAALQQAESAPGFAGSASLLRVAGLSALALASLELALEYLGGVARSAGATEDDRYNFAIALARAERFAEAEPMLRSVLAAEPRHLRAVGALAGLCFGQARFDEADALYREVLATDPVPADAHLNFALLCLRRKRFAEAEHHFRRVLAIDPGHHEAAFNLGTLLLAQGRFDEGWLHCRRRTEPRRGHAAVSLPRLPFARWQGESLAGKRFLLWFEQGFGDQIQFCRYVSRLREAGASSIELVCAPPLCRLMESLAGVDRVIPFGTDTTFSRPDFWALPLDLPGLFATDIASIPARLPYLAAQGDEISRWAARLPTAGLRVGLVWKGSSAHANDSHRSLPSLATLAPLWAVAGVRFVSLQKGQGEEEVKRFATSRPIVDLGSQIADFADCAAIIAGLDLVICVDTAIAHLAGALDKPCWVMLPDENTDWRWLREREDSPWYPGAVRLFRQSSPGDWSGAVARVRDALARLPSRPAAKATGP